MTGLHLFWEKMSLLPCLFQLLDATYIPWLLVSSFIFEVSSVASSTMSDCDLSPSCMFYGPLWLHWGHPDNPEWYLHFKILNPSQSLFSHVRQYITNYRGYDMGIFEGHYSVYHMLHLRISSSLVLGILFSTVCSFYNVCDVNFIE